MITRDNAFGHLLFDILLSIVYYSKQGLDTFDLMTVIYVDGIYLLRLNQEAVYISV